MFASTDARRVVFWVAAAAIVVAQVAILRTARAYVQAPAQADRRPTPWLEAFWAVAPAVGLLVMLAFAWRRL
ncbi:MAG: hypothetical protein MUF53_01525 [Gemmatimonadaceae bacterium]|nr:hypothetical protein [Gemmatimonadaceae bacterium]